MAKKERPPVHPVMADLVYRRYMSGMTQKQIAKMLDTSVKRVREIERSHDPMISTLAKYGHCVETRLEFRVTEREPYEPAHEEKPDDA